MAETIIGTEFADILNGTAEGETILAQGGNDTVNAGDGDDTIYGGLGNDSLFGDDGNDLFIQDLFTSATDVFNGGAGTDTLELRSLANPIVSQQGLLSQHIMPQAGALVSIERIVFASQAGTSLQALVQVGTAAASGVTEIVGGAGRDLMTFSTGGSAGTYTTPNLIYTGFSPIATNSWEANALDVVLLLSTVAPGSGATLNAAAGLAVNQVLIGGIGDDTLNGSANGDVLNGAGGVNVLNGNDGNDSLAIVNQQAPGALSPTFYTGAGSVLDGGTGTDALVIGGFVNLEATLVSIEGVILQPAFIPPQPNTPLQENAVLVLDSADLAMLPGNAFFGGTGTVVFLPDDGASLNLSAYTFLPGHAVRFEVEAGIGSGITVTGSSTSDLIFLGEGNQAALGGAGNDRIVFGFGNQVATGGTGADRFGIGAGSGHVTDFTIGEDKIDFTETGITSFGRLNDLNIAQTGANVTISADSGGQHYEIVIENVLLANLSESDVILGTQDFGQLDFGTGFNDLLFGSQYTDELHGGDGNDRIYGGGGADFLFGDGGDDVLIIDGAVEFGAIYDGGTGFDRIELRPTGLTTFYGMFGLFTGIEEMVFASEAGQTLTGAVTYDAILNGLSNVVGGAGSDTFVLVVTQPGEYSIPALSITDWNNGVPAAQGGDSLVLVAAEQMTESVTLLAQGANTVLVGAQGADTLIGSTFFGSTVTMFGNGGNDLIYSYGGNNLLYGGDGNDFFFTGYQGDLVFEQAGGGHDTIIAFGSYYLYANVEDLGLDPAAEDAFGVGNELANFIQGNDWANLLIGGAGDDWIAGASGNDSLFGESGNDTLVGGAGIDYLVGGLGNDQIHGGSDADALYGEDGDDILEGGTSFDTDILVGGAGNDVLDGDSGQEDPDYDLLDGDSGNDIYYVDTGVDLTFEDSGGGIDTVYADVPVPNAGVYLYANVENLILLGTTAFGVGNELDNSLTGSASGNWLLGGAGNDRIDGQAGNDVLFGETGADTFVFGVGHGKDLIGDFDIAQDKIELHAAFTSFAQIQASMVQDGANMAIDLGFDSLVVLNGVNKDDLTAANFILTASAEAPAGNAAVATAMESFALDNGSVGADADGWQAFQLQSAVLV